MLLHEMELCLEFLWQPQIVTVQESNIAASRLSNASIARHGYPLVLLQTDIANLLIMEGFNDVHNRLW